jgi:hypothetical protein
LSETKRQEATVDAPIESKELCDKDVIPDYGGVMKRFLEIGGCALALCLPMFAQSPAGSPQLVKAAFGSPAGSPQDQDDRNPNWSDDRDREWHREHDQDHKNWDDDRDRAYHNHGYHGVLAPEWQGKFDSYYQRWLNYRATNNESQMSSMEKRMQDIMRNYNIPPNVPYDDIASGGR